MMMMMMNDDDDAEKQVRLDNNLGEWMRMTEAKFSCHEAGRNVSKDA